MVEEKVGDPKLTEIRENFQAEQRQNIVKAELLKQNQDLERKVASQDAEIKRIKTQADATQKEILQKMELKKIELEKARSELQFRQEKMRRAMEAIGKAVSAQGYPRDPREVEVIRELLGALGSISGSEPDVSARPEHYSASGSGKPSSSDRIDTLTDMLLSLSDRRRS